MGNYENKYKEALEKARQLCTYPTTKPFISDLQDLFPELTESNDERIRKELIDAILGLWDNDALPMPLSVKRKDEWIAWLEKQEEPELSEDLGEYVAELSKQFPEVSFAKLSRIAVRVKNWIEKQGEQKSTDKPKFEIGDEIKTDNEDPLTITKIDEQGYWSGDLFICSFEDSAKWELVGKIIKPKFKVGDWIIHQGTENIYQVVSRIDNQYQLKYGDNYTIQKCADVDKDARLWTIDDAKDGDVLADDDNNIFIFDGTVEEGKYPFAYCGLTAQGFDSYDIRLPFTHDNNIHPATWEQRNLLFKKMKESGYEWNDEKKELKKIEKKSQRMVSAEVKEALYDKPTDEEMKELLRTEYEKGRADTIAEMYVPTQISPEESLGVSSEKYMDIVDTLTQGGQKPAKWSLEDERVIAIINNALTESNTPPDDYDKVYDWLESLRQKIGG